jgi:septal ring factor EnvC (AmiA/AmiB activator)
MAVLFSISLYAQSNVEQQDNLSLDSGTIDNQFDFVIKRSNRYQEYKVVRTAWLNTLKAHTLDSLKAIQDQLDNTRNTVNAQQTEIDGLKSELESTKATLDTTNLEKNSIALLGMQMSKTNYNLILWTVIGLLLILLLIFIFKFKNSNTVTRKAKRSLADIEEEFEEHRRNALEREQKVRRQLQDEINKQKGTS